MPDMVQISSATTGLMPVKPEVWNGAFQQMLLGLHSADPAYAWCPG